MSRFAWKGHIFTSGENRELNIYENSYVLCEDGICKGVVKELPADWSEVSVTDFGDKLIIPGFSDLHIHAPQYTYRGTGMDLELLDWLQKYAFPEESRYSDLQYADKAYGIFADALRRGATTRACVFASAHTEATELLMDKMEATGLKSYIGRVNMDRNAPDTIREKDADFGASETERWIVDTKDKYQNTKPMITPRFIPSCTDELMYKLGDIQKKYGVAVQSHVSENLSEIAWVAELCPNSKFYGDAYESFGLFGGEGCPTVMAHCVYSSEEEQELMKRNNVFIAHCPQSNMNVASGIAPVRTYLEKGLKMGLGSDIAGGSSDSIFRAMTDAVMSSKLRWRLVDQNLHQISVADAFYMATRGGGEFFGKVGAFEEGFEFDAVVIDDSPIAVTRPMSMHDRFERDCYLYHETNIAAKCVAGKIIDLS